jgi:Helix-turn-helix
MSFVLTRNNKLNGNYPAEGQNVEKLRPSEINKEQLAENLSLPDSSTSTAFEEYKVSGSGKTYLRCIFVYLREPPVFILQVYEKGKKQPTRAIALSSKKDARRIINAWKMDSSEQLIAFAKVSGNCLDVIDCALGAWTIPFDGLPALASILVDDRANFELDVDGSYLYWFNADVHLDMESLKVCVDPKLKEALDSEKLQWDQQFGKAVAKVRKKFKLRQSDIPGVSARHVQRIEKGSRPKTETLEKLAEAHNLNLNSYLIEISLAAEKLST